RRNGAPHLQAVRSLPQQFTRRSDTQAPIAFFTNSGGTFTLSWTLRDVPDPWQLHLRDAVTGDVVNLRTATEHVFSASGAGWAERFTLSVTPAAPFADAHLGLPDGYALSPVYPNPARSSARFALEVAEAQDVTVAVYDVLGRRVALLHDGLLADGTEHAFTVDG